MGLRPLFFSGAGSRRRPGTTSISGAGPAAPRRGVPNLRHFVLPVALFLLTALSATLRAEEAPRRILLINSYDSTDPWTRNLNAGFQEYLAKRQIPVRYDIRDLDVRGTPGKSPRQETIRALQELLDRNRYDLIVAGGNDAADLFFNQELTVARETPLLVLNYQGGLTGKHAPNLPMTGVVSTLRPYALIHMSLQLRPEARRAVLVVGATAEDRAYLRRLREDTAPAPSIQLEIFSGTEYSTGEILEKLRELPPEETLVLFHSWSSTREEFSDANRALLLAAQRFHGLILGGQDNLLDYGAAGGLLVSGHALGARGAELAERILGGERASDIPIQSVAPRKAIRYRALQEQRLREADLPEDLEVLDAPRNFLRDNWPLLLTVAVIALLFFQCMLFRLYYYKRMMRQIRGLFRKLPVRVVVTDGNGKVLFSHVPDPDAELSADPQQIDPGHPHAAEILRAISELARGERQEAHLEYRSCGRDRRLILLPLNDDSLFHTRGVIGVSSDVTELREAHRQMALLADRFQMTLRSIGDAVIATDAEERITFLNPVAALLTGWPLEEARGKKLCDVFNIVTHPEGKPAQSPLALALREGRTVELNHHTDLISRDGKRRHIADSAAPIRESGGRISGGVLVFRDVTEEYEKRNRLRRNDLILENAGRMAKFSDFTCDLEGNIQYTRLGDELGPLKDGNLASAREWIAPSDFAILARKWKALSSGAIEEFNCSYTTAPGRPVRHFELWMRRSRNESSGRPEIFGVIQDITVLKENELRYRNNLQLLETIMNHLPGFIFVKDPDNGLRYLAGNLLFQELAGHTEAEIVGHTDEEIFRSDPASVEKFRRDDLTVLRTGKPLDTEEVLNNTTPPRVVRTIKTVITHAGGSRLLIGMGIDVTERHRLEQERQQMIRDLERYISWERLANRALTYILQENDFSKVVPEILGLIGNAAGADRCYVFRYRDASCSRAVYEWSWLRDGVSTLASDETREIDLRQYPETFARLREGRECFYSAAEMRKEGAASPELSTLIRQNVYARMLNRITIDGQPYGFIGLDYDRDNLPDGDLQQIVRNLSRLYQLACERNSLNNRLADSAALQRQILENISIPLRICDTDFNIVMINSKAREACLPPFSRRNADDFGDGVKCYEASCGAGAAPPECPLRQVLLSGRECSREHEYRGRHIRTSAQPLRDHHGELRYILLSDIDLTDIVHQKEELRHAMEAAQAADRAKSMFLATMSHEIRTPLNAVLGFSELLRHDGVTKQEQTEYLEAIRLAGNSLLGLLNDILDLSKLEAEQLEITPVPTDLPELIHEVAAIFSDKIRRKHLEFRQEFPEQLPILELDRLRLRQILLNLLGNAVKFTEHGSISLRVTFEERGDDGRLQIDVSDTGIGIRKEAREKIFQPFMQQDAVRDTHVYNGTGLGLAISQRLVNRMGGSILLESEENRGSTFRIVLPHVGCRKDALSGTVSRAVAETSPALSADRVLIVDDVSINLELLAAMLRKFGLRTLTAASGKEALEQLRESDVDLIITDLWMPGMNGAELAAAIHARPELANLKIVALSADTEAAGNFPQQEFFDTLQKPVTMRKLEELFRKLRETGWP